MTYYKPKKYYEAPARPSYTTTNLVQCFGEGDSRINEVFRVGGILDLGSPNYEYRGAQVELAQMSFRALKLRKKLLAHAETGTGKSIGLLVPAIEWALRTQGKVVICTATNILLEQYVSKDLPMLEKVLRNYLTEEYGRNFKWGSQKGRANYVCQYKVRSGPIVYDNLSELNQIKAWMETSETGDFCELPFDINAPNLFPLKMAVTSTSDECLGEKECPNIGECSFYGRKGYNENVDILLVSHATVAMDIQLQGRLLGDYGALIVDEAHQFEEYVRGSLEEVVSFGKFKHLIRRLRKAGIDVTNLQALGDRLFEELAITYDELSKGETAEKIDLTNIQVPAKLSQTLEELHILLGFMAVNATRVNNTPLNNSCNTLARTVQALKAPAENTCSWLEKNSEVEIKNCPIDVGQHLALRLWNKPAILSSATLAIGKGEHAFTYVKSQLGIYGNPFELCLDSPFDWEKNALYILPGEGAISESDMKMRKGEKRHEAVFRWGQTIFPFIQKILRITEGRAFVLCTSRGVAEDLYRRHQGSLSFPSMCQGQAPKGTTVEWFKRTDNSVLYATASYWEGVDVPDGSLVCVVIDRLPFPSPADPLESAKAAKFGKEYFVNYQIPYTQTKLNQGVGRLLRNQSNRGIIVLMDPRIRTKAYGKTILKNLPGSPLYALATKKIDISGFLNGGKIDNK